MTAYKSISLYSEEVQSISKSISSSRTSPLSYVWHRNVWKIRREMVGSTKSMPMGGGVVRR